MPNRTDTKAVPQPDVDAPYHGASETHASGWCIAMDDDRCSPISWSPSRAGWIRCKCECHDGISDADVRAGILAAFDQLEFWRGRRFP